MFVLLQFAVGLLALASVCLPVLLRERLISFPIIVVAGGLLLPLAFQDGNFDPVTNGFAAEHLTEFAVIVALTGLGLSIDRPVTWRGWRTAWRLLAVTMPLTIVVAAFVGWWIVGLAPAAALLFGAVLGPTDPVLAADVQTGPPSTGNPDVDESDEVRFGLTSESSLNDGLAFPFTNLAILVAVVGPDPTEWIVEWVVIDVGYKIVGGVAVGLLLGRVLGRLTLRIVRELHAGEGIAPALLALAYTLTSYGLAELAETYGFIAVFVTAATIRHTERQNQVHDHLHEGAEQLELLGMSVVLLLLGAAFVDGLWRHVTVEMVLAALVLILVVRPAAGWLGLVGHRSVSRPERAMIAFFGIRGLGSLFYLAYGLNHAEFADASTLWALTGVTVLMSLVVHGLTARPAMRWLDEQRSAV